MIRLHQIINEVGVGCAKAKNQEGVVNLAIKDVDARGIRNVVAVSCFVLFVSSCTTQT